MHAPAKYVLNLRGEHTVYCNQLGTRLPGVTTVLGVLDKPALLEWAAREEREYLLDAAKLGHNWQAAINEQYAYAVKRDKAADIGTVAHARIHASLRGMDLDEDGLPLEAVVKSIPGWNRWATWWEAEKMSCIATELPMVSETMQIGGTADVVAESPHGLTLADVKSSNPHPKWPWDEVISQVAAYRAIWNELNPTRPIVRACSYRCGKTEGDTGQVAWFTTGQLTAGMNLFMAALEAYRAKRDLRRMAS